MKTEALHQLFKASNGITTDTRNLTKRAIFFALKGANFNGNLFAEKAISEGCAYAVVDEAEFATDERIILVESVLKALQDLANYHRKQFDIPVIGITGSNGKTTSKELIGAVLSQKYEALITEGNLNNHLGVPFTLLRLNTSHEIAIIEMGANKPGDIKELVEIAEPTHGIITNIGAAHIEGFGSLEGVIKTKGELYDFINATSGTVFFNSEDDTLKQILPTNADLIGFGLHGGGVRGILTKQTPFVSFSWSNDNYESPELDTHLVGRYNFTNFIAAICIGTYFDVEVEAINSAIENYVPSNNRSQVSKTDRNTLIVDCYNANPTSMKAALDSFLEMTSNNKLAILGDMLELGDISAEEHLKMVDFLKSNGLDAILVGKEMKKVQTDYKQYSNWEELVENESLDTLSNHLILLKGSRGIRLEELIQYL